MGSLQSAWCEHDVALFAIGKEINRLEEELSVLHAASELLLEACGCPMPKSDGAGRPARACAVLDSDQHTLIDSDLVEMRRRVVTAAEVGRTDV